VVVVEVVEVDDVVDVDVEASVVVVVGASSAWLGGATRASSTEAPTTTARARNSRDANLFREGRARL
jgi:hypothetical protein